MSNLELLIKQCRKIWQEMKVPLKLRDEMIDTLVVINQNESTNLYTTTYAYDKITKEGIKQATLDYISKREKGWNILEKVK
jgi:hypothetical protein